MSEEKKVDQEQTSKVLDMCMEAWHKLERVEIIMKNVDNHIEGVGTLVSHVVKDVKNCQTNI